ncbi:cytochrome c oxidase subunit II [Paenibacillus sp. PR3]|uniref:Cytochrome aa3 subunit 2 n=1 Tax=Paenibacillus terricola TaxID=2763503 RepID=A0ABR8MUJ2_9BACL|nr:cytochrome c oxidase subunit II [Paenibacillus terricola]MBD3919629.1 cytochrome c oxidase subunit II [Paenibacillus terricola]
MHVHRLEKIWLSIGISMLAIFLVVIAATAFGMGMSPPSEHHHTIDPTQVTTTAPFDDPGLKQTGDNRYEAVMIAYAFGYEPQTLEVPVGATIDFTVTSSDVVHGFEIVGTNVNMMIEPGEVSHISHKFDKPGVYLVLCNEYCGTGHEYMKTTIVVK